MKYLVVLFFFHFLQTVFTLTNFVIILFWPVGKYRWMVEWVGCILENENGNKRNRMNFSVEVVAGYNPTNFIHSNFLPIFGSTTRTLNYLLALLCFERYLHVFHSSIHPIQLTFFSFFFFHFLFNYSAVLSRIDVFRAMGNSAL